MTRGVARFAELREQIRDATVQGVGLDQIGAELIEPAALDDDDKAALWLYAWSLARRPRPGAVPSAEAR